MRYEIHIPRFRPATINEMDGNRWKRARLKRRDRELIGAFFIMAGLARAGPHSPSHAPPRRVSLRVTLTRGREPDPDSLWKSTLDALTHVGALRDDSSRWCRLGPVEFSRGKTLSTTIILEDLEEA